jgi:hypothetical protein
VRQQPFDLQSDDIKMDEYGNYLGCYVVCGSDRRTKEESYRIVITSVGLSGHQFYSTELLEIGYQSGTDNSKIRIVIVIALYKEGKSAKTMKNAEKLTVLFLFLFLEPYKGGPKSNPSIMHQLPLHDIEHIPEPPGRSGKIRFLLVASTANQYQEEVRRRTFLDSTHTVRHYPLPVNCVLE